MGPIFVNLMAFLHFKNIKIPFKLAFSTGRDNTNFWDKGTEVSSLSWDKGTTGQAQNLAKSQEGMRDGTVQDLDSLSLSVLRDKTEQSRKGGTIKKDHLFLGSSKSE